MREGRSPSPLFRVFTHSLLLVCAVMLSSGQAPAPKPVGPPPTTIVVQPDGVGAALKYICGVDACDTASNNNELDGHFVGFVERDFGFRVKSTKFTGLKDAQAVRIVFNSNVLLQGFRVRPPRDTRDQLVWLLKRPDGTWELLTRNHPGPFEREVRPDLKYTLVSMEVDYLDGSDYKTLYYNIDPNKREIIELEIEPY